MTSFFDEKPESSDDIKITDEHGYLINPVTGGNVWHHSSQGHDTIFSDDYLEKSSRFAGTYHTAKTNETLTNGYYHINHIRMSNPLVLATHHDVGTHGARSETENLERGQFHTLPGMVRHYIFKYGGKVLPEYGDPNEEGAEKRFYEEQNNRNQARLDEWKETCDRIDRAHEEDPWHVSETKTQAYKPPRPVLENREFSSDYISNFTPKQRLHVLREGALLDGYDGFMFHYNSSEPTIFVIKPSLQIVSNRILRENSQEFKDYQKDTKQTLGTGLDRYIRKNDLFEAERFRGKGRAG